MNLKEEEIHSITDMGQTPWELNELVKLAVKNYKKAAKTIVGWHISAEPGKVSLKFMEASGNEFDEIIIDKHDYIEIFKPAILAI